MAAKSPVEESRQMMFKMADVILANNPPPQPSFQPVVELYRSLEPNGSDRSSVPAVNWPAALYRAHAGYLTLSPIPLVTTHRCVGQFGGSMRPVATSNGRDNRSRPRAESRQVPEEEPLISANER